MLTPFSEKVIATIRKVPRGKVATYKQIAELVESPHAIRGVVWILHSSSKKYRLPWYRILNSRGRISFKEGTKSHQLQKAKLKAEGVVFGESGQLDLKKYQWKKAPKKVRSSRTGPHMFS